MARPPQLHHNHGPFANIELCAMIADPKTQAELEGLAKPVNRGIHVGITQFGDHRASGH